MSERHDDARRAAKTVTDLVNETQAGERLWTRAPASDYGLPADPTLQTKELLASKTTEGEYVLRVGVDQQGDLLHTLFLLSGDGPTPLGPDAPALLQPYLKDLYRAASAQFRVLSLAEAGGGIGDRHLANATDLATWAGRLDAQSTLPQLVRRLITATANDLTQISARAGEGVGLPGWDIVTEAASWSAFVPEGLSVWELGVGDPSKKAQSDYRKRTDAPGDVDPAATTFVFVSPRRWPEKDAWVERKKADGVWKGVRVIDGDDLEAWLETAPAVHAWISARLGKDPWEAESLEQWWTEWSGATRPALPAAVLLSGRNEEAQRVLELLSQTQGSTTVVGDSQDEALAFLAAALADAPQRLDRALVVRTGGAWQRLSSWTTSLILIPTFERPSVATAVQSGHHVIVPLGREAKTSGGIELPRVRRSGIEAALQGAGVPRNRASELATLGRRSLFALRRTLAINPDADRPEWAEPDHARSIALAVLSGSWNDGSEGDRAAVAEIAGRPYEEVARDLTRWSNSSNPPVRRVGDVWLVAAKADTWTLTAHALTTDDLDRFRHVATSVIGGDDPALDLPPDQRPGASLLGKQRAHSGLFVNAMADTLAMMAASDPDVALVGGRRGETEASVVVGTVLRAANEDETGRLWHAASSALPLLAEAAPDKFLRAVQAGSRDAEGPVLTLFQDTSGFLSASSPHPSLLWALETLAWNEDYLAQAARVLAVLTRIAPPTKIVNRPFDSLRNILVLWVNGTSAPVETRVQVLESIGRVEPDVAFRLAVALIPTGSSTASPPSSPRYRDWKPDDADEAVPGEAFGRALAEVVRLACGYAGTDGARWAALFDHVASTVYHGARADVLEALETLDPDNMSAEGRRMLYQTLRGIAGKHERYADARWAMPEDHLQRLSDLTPRFEPVAAVDRHRWLFEQGALDSFVEKGDEDRREQQRRLHEAQVQAVEELLREIDVQGLATWTGELSKPEFSARYVGRALAQVRPDDPNVLGLLTVEDEVARRIGAEYVYLAYQLHGLPWAGGALDDHADEWGADVSGLFLRALPVSSEVWALADARDEAVADAYWAEIHPFALPSDGEDALTAARRLVSAGRPWAALQLFQHMFYGSEDAVPLDFLADTLEAAYQTADEPFDGTTAQDIGGYLDRLDAAEFDPNRLAQLEWAYLRLLRFDRRRSGVLHRALAEEPEFFVQILSFAYRAVGEEPKDLTEGEKVQASNAHTLLESWQTMPGLREDGTIDADALGAWVDEAQRLLRDAGRIEIGEQYIGRVLRYGPKPKPVPLGEGDAPAEDTPPPALVDWPAEEIRDLIERVASDDLETGFELEVYNSRGVTSRGMTDGGDRERYLVQLYRQRAAFVRATHPRTAAMLKRIADSYLRDAERYDRDAALTEDTWR